QYRDGGSGRSALEHTGQDLRFVRLHALCDQFALPRTAPQKIWNQVGLGELQTGWTTVDDHHVAGPMRLSRSGDHEGLTEAVTCHDGLINHGLVARAWVALRATRPGYPEATIGAMTQPPLTRLTEEELLFKNQVLGFAKERIAPLVAEMDRRASLEPKLLPALFELGLMGIEVPETYGGSGSSFFSAIV